MPRFRTLTRMGMGLLMALVTTPGWAAEGSAGAVANLPTPTAQAERARQLLHEGRLAQAERLVRGALAGGADDSLLCVAGEIEFRRANFAEAVTAYEAAIALNPGNARAYWGLGRIEQAHFRGLRARDLFSKAFSLNHRDPDIILAYADFVTDPGSKSTLLDNVVRLARPDQPEQAERAVAQRLIHQRLQGRVPSRLASPYSAYRLPLTGFRPISAAQDGMLVSTRINGGKPLRLLLDTGARGMVVDARAARNLGLEMIVDSLLGGLGETGAVDSRVALARTVAFGDLVFEECLIEVSGHSLTAGADGVLGADVFERFKIGVDPQARVLQLTPFDDSTATLADRALNLSQESIPAVGVRNLLLVKSRVEGGKEGLFLLDTGAAYSAVSQEYLPVAVQPGHSVNLQGAEGSLSGAIRVGPLQFRLGGLPLVETAPLAMDLRHMSQLEGIEIAGILGYSVLGKSPFTIDLRNGVVEFARAGSR